MSFRNLGYNLPYTIFVSINLDENEKSKRLLPLPDACIF